jgi:hypothetical protein
MVLGKTRKIVVIKNIPSNIIEEAILILKSEHDPKDVKDYKGVMKTKKVKSNDYLVKEAEYIINNYVKESKLVSRQDTELSFKEVKASRKKFFISMAINFGWWPA